MNKRLVGLILISLIVALPICFSKEISLSYDANGNLIQDENNYYEYNSLNQLVRVREDSATGRVIEEYGYDPNGERLFKYSYSADGYPTVTYYIDRNIVRVMNGSGVFDTIYYYQGDQLIAREDFDGAKYYYHPDHIGSTNIVTDQSGNVVERTEYMPFGEVAQGGSDRFTFTGQENDKETGLMYYGARYYSPSLKRFTQPDTIIPDIYDPQLLNRYSYARNNPVRYTDPSGHGIGSAIAAIVAAAVDMIKQIVYDGRSIFEGTIDYGEAFRVGVSVGVGFEIGTGVSRLLGPLFEGARGVTAFASNVIRGAASTSVGFAGTQVTYNVLTGESITHNVYESAVSGAKWGGAVGAVAEGIGVLRESNFLSSERIPSWGSMKGEVDVIRPWTGVNRYWGGTNPSGTGATSKMARWTTPLETNNPIYARDVLGIPGGPPIMRTGVSYGSGAKLRIGTTYKDKAFQVEYLSGPRTISSNDYMLDDYAKFIN